PILFALEAMTASARPQELADLVDAVFDPRIFFERFLQPNDERGERSEPGQLGRADQRLEEGAISHAAAGALVLAPLRVDERAVQVKEFASHPHKMRPPTRQIKARGAAPSDD